MRMQIIFGTLLWTALVSPVFAENPFQGNPDPAEPAIPSSPSDFQEDDFSDADENFGINPPPGAGVPPFQGQPPSTQQDFAPPTAAPTSPVAPKVEPPTQIARPTPPRPTPKPTPPSNPGRPGADSTARATPPLDPSRTAGRPGGKATQQPPKLADYLELDPSVKGLEVKNFDLPDKDIKDVVTLISKWTGKNFIIDNKVRGKITIIGPSQVTLQEAYHAFLSALEANGLTTVQSGKFIRIIESAEARRAPVETFAGEYAPGTDQFITRIFQLKYINADEVQREFRDLTTRQGKLFAYEPTNSIIITDTGSNIKRIEGILQVLDVKSFETTLHVLKIVNGSAKVIADMLGEIYGDDKGARGGSGPRTFRRSALERTRGGGIISKIIPDEATNSLVVLANEAGYVQLRVLVAKLDVKITDTGRIHVYYCEYAKAEDLAATLSALATGSPGAKSRQNARPSAGPGGAPGTAPTGGGSAAGPVTAELEGGVKITSDASTNSLVITANSADYQTIKRVIKKLDIPRLQVFVETAILEVTLDNSDKVGVNIAAGVPVRGFGGGFIGDSESLIGAITGGIAEGASIPFFAGPSFNANVRTGATSTSSISVNSLMGIVSLLSKTTNTSVLSTPQIIALDNEKAEFKVLDETPVQTSFTALAAGTSAPTGTATGSIERLKTGIEIKLTPHVNAASRSVRLEIEQTVNNTKQSTEVPEALRNVNVGTTSRVTNTSVVVRDRDYVMLGGLMSDKVDESVTKVPLLGDIPILGWLFKSRRDIIRKTNLIILLQPRIIGTSLDSANLIRSNLEERKEFVDKNSGGSTPQDEGVKKIEARIKNQQERGKTEKPFDYRNNNTNDSIDDSPVNTQASPESILDTPDPKEEEAPKQPKASPPKAAKKEVAPAVEEPTAEEDALSPEAPLLAPSELPLDLPDEIPNDTASGIENESTEVN